MPNPEWDDAAERQRARLWFDQLGDAGPETWALLNGTAAPLLEQFGADLCEALDQEDIALVSEAWAQFRREFGKVWRVRKQAG